MKLITKTSNHTKFSIQSPFDRLSVNFYKHNMDNSQNASYQAGQAKGEAQEKGNQMMDKASNVAQAVKESVQSAGAQAQEKAHNAADAVKDATGMNK